jgi:hypothetical protein
MKKLENLLDFEDFKANWKEKDANCPFRKK